MKIRIIALLLAMIGMGGCCQKPHKGKEMKVEPVIEHDSIIEPIRLMYGVPNRVFEVRENVAPADATGKRLQ